MFPYKKVQMVFVTSWIRYSVPFIESPVGVVCGGTMYVEIPLYGGVLNRTSGVTARRFDALVVLEIS